jgi:hypothetical protein
MTRRRGAARTGFWLVWAAIFLVAAAHGAQALQATSADGRWRVVSEGTTIVIEDTAGAERPRSLRAIALDGSGASEVASIHDATRRRSFVINFRTLPELWELSYDPRAEPIYDGLVHDYKMGEAIAIPGFLNPRRTKLESPLQGLVFDRSHAFVLGRADDGVDGRVQLHLVQLDIRRVIARFAVAGNPDLPAAQALLDGKGRSVIRVPDRGGGAATVVDVRGARIVPAAD